MVSVVVVIALAVAAGTRHATGAARNAIGPTGVASRLIQSGYNAEICGIGGSGS